MTEIDGRPSAVPQAERCPACGSADPAPFYEARGVPSNSCILMDSAEEAVGYPRGDIVLGLCDACGFIANLAFDKALTEYSARYEETQGFSPTFSRWHRNLAEQLVTRHRLAGKTVVEIGCGKGEFLTLLCELGAAKGIGFDPAYRPERNTGPAADRVEVVRDFYSDRYAGIRGDFLCCKMTLEHIPAVGDFVATVRRSMDGWDDAIVFFQVPEASIILDGLGFWDVYYEHCSYFTPDSLHRLFASCGFEVLSVDTDYGDQYLMIEARPAASPDTPPTSGDADRLASTRRLVERFRASYRPAVDGWRRRLDEAARRGERTVLWGSGSKGVSFLTTVGLGDQIAAAVDINPYRQGKYMPGTGHRIVGPDDLPALRPDRVVVMNPIYRQEIGAMLAERGLAPEILTV